MAKTNLVATGVTFTPKQNQNYRLKPFDNQPQVCYEQKKNKLQGSYRQFVIATKSCLEHELYIHPLL